MPLTIVRNDITKMKVDAIVNAAKESLLGGGGVDGCIHRTAGPKLLEECRTLGGCKTGSAKITAGYDLPCRHVIHTVGPVWNGGGYGEREKLVSCYKSSLELAKEYGCETVAFPLISSGIFGYPKAQALRVAVDTISEFLLKNDMTVYIVVFDKAAYQIGGKLFADIKEYIDDNSVSQITQMFARRSRYILSSYEPTTSSTRLPIEKSFPRDESRTDFDVWNKLELEDILTKTDAGFSEMLMLLIDKTGKKDSEIYKKANVDRKLFSKIRSNPDYKPSKPTVLAFAIALELDLDSTKDLLSRAGFALSHSSKFDMIVEYFIKNGNYNIFHINEALFAFDQSLLGA